MMLLAFSAFGDTVGPEGTEAILLNAIWVAPGTPGERAYVSMAYDSESKLSILYGGECSLCRYLFPAHPQNPDHIHNDTWAYSHSSKSWSEMEPMQTPNSAGGNQMVYESGADRAIFFGGPAFYTGEETHCTWTYSHNQNTWENLTKSPSPPRRSGNCIAYDSESAQVVIFGGFRSTNPDSIYPLTFYTDTWAFNYAEGTWQNMTPVASPSIRAFGRMVYDIESDVIILFGGWEHSLTPGHFQSSNSETWAYSYNLNVWTRMNPELNPPPRAYHGMVYDSKNDRVVLFGGVQSEFSECFNDTWTYSYNSDRWSRMNCTVAPQGRRSHGMVYDSEADRTIVYGGHLTGYASVGSISGEMWEYSFDDNTWTLVQTSTTGWSVIGAGATVLVILTVLAVSVRRYGLRKLPVDSQARHQ